MGVVYEAVRQKTESRVALKAVKVADAGLLGSLRREIAGLRRLSHPGIVRIIDEGTFEGMPWYAMTLMEGVSLRRVIDGSEEDTAPSTEPATDSPTLDLEETHHLTAPDGAEDHPTAPLGDLPGSAARPPVCETDDRPPESAELRGRLTLVRRLCDPLRYLHGEGLVHRDLKPDNVLIQPDGRPVIIDFGLVATFTSERSRETADIGGLVTGTIGYMAPEQLEGRTIDARADLYALGCILYELVTGRRPHPGSSLEAIIRRTLTSDPAPPSHHAPGVDPKLDALVLRLLAKDPRERFGYADDVARALESLGAESTPPSGPAARTYLYRPRLAGRSEELRQIQRRLESVAGGEPSFVLVSGESGVGKTRFVSEVTSLATAMQFQVHLGGCLPDHPGGLAGFRGILRSLGDQCREKGAGETDRIFGNRLKVLTPYEESLEGVPGAETHPTPAPLDGGAARLRVLNSVARAAVAASASGPALFVIDDAQWADELTLAAVEHLCRLAQVKGAPVCLVITCRAEEPRRQLEQLAKEGVIAPLRLGQMEPDHIGEIAADMLAHGRLASGFSRFLARCSEGNPFYVAEYLRAAVETGVLVRKGDGSWRFGDVDDDATEDVYAALPIPGSVRELVLSHAAGLPAPARALLEAMAICGRESSWDVVGSMVDGSAAAQSDAVVELVRRRLIRDGVDRLVFEHDRVRSVVESSIAADRSRHLHERAATAIEALDDEKQRSWLGTLGRHWEIAGKLEEARRGYLAGARKAMAEYVLEEAERLLRSYLDLVQTPTAESIGARNQLGRKTLLFRGMVAEAEAEHRRALEEARAVGDRGAEGACLIFVGNVLRSTSRLEEATSAYRQALTIFREEGNRMLEGQVLGNLAVINHQRGRLDEARALYEEGRIIFRAGGHRDSEAIALSNLSLVQRGQGRLEESRTLLDQALAIFRELHDRGKVGGVLGNMAGVHQVLGQMEEALACYEQSIAIAREVEDRRTEGIMIGNLACLHQEQGRLERARALYEQSIAIHREVGDRRSEGVDLGNLAHLYLELGRMEEAQALHEKALAYIRQLGDRLHEGAVLGTFAALCLFTGAGVEEARRRTAEAVRLLREVGSRFDLGNVYTVDGHAVLSGGADPLEQLELARQLVADTAAGARSFLGENVARLARAREVFLEGRPLVCGYAPTDLTPAQYVWLQKHRPAAIPAAVAARLRRDGRLEPEPADPSDAS